MSSHPETLGRLIKRIQHANHRDLDKRLAPLGVSLVQWNALREIDRNPGRSQHHLAEQTFSTDQSFGTLLVRLLAAELIERQPGKGRSAAHKLTHAGRALLDSGQKIMLEVTENSFAPLTHVERAVLSSLLGKVLQARNYE